MAGEQVPVLPPDLFHVLSLELAARLDFSTLYNCVTSSKYLANAGAVNALYRVCHESGFSDAVNLATTEQDLVAKWSVLWSSIIRSAMGKTFSPYCRHLRVLDLKDLFLLLETLDEPKFRNKIGKQFFAGDFAKFHHTFDKSVKWRSGRLKVQQSLVSIADEVIGSAPLLSSLTEPNAEAIFLDALPRWIPKLGHLRELTLWDGKALGDESLQKLLHVYAPGLSRLSIYTSTDTQSDHRLAAFISGMRENTLVTFETISDVTIGRETCLALNHHGKSLTTLKLALKEDGLLALGLLQGCTSIEVLSLESLATPADLKTTKYDLYLEILGWLGSRTLLKDVTLVDLPSAPDLLLPLLLNNNVKLQRLQIKSNESSMYSTAENQDFHAALRAQPSLRALILRADPDPPSREGIETLLESICSLKELRELNLTRISDFFTDEHLNQLAHHLPQLSSIYVGGYGISDSVLDAMSSMKALSQLNFAGITSFTVNGLLDFVAKLGTSNQGLWLSVDSADPDSMLSQEAQDLVKDAIVTKLGGTFEYQPLRDPNVPEFDQSDSD